MCEAMNRVNGNVGMPELGANPGSSHMLSSSSFTSYGTIHLKDDDSKC